MGYMVRKDIVHIRWWRRQRRFKRCHSEWVLYLFRPWKDTFCFVTMICSLFNCFCLHISSCLLPSNIVSVITHDTVGKYLEETVSNHLSVYIDFHLIRHFWSVHGKNIPLMQTSSIIFHLFRIAKNSDLQIVITNVNLKSIISNSLLLKWN